MALIKRVPIKPELNILGLHKLTIGLSIALVLLSVVLFAVQGLNFGVDFRGGILMEVRTKAETADIADFRNRLNGLNLGDVTIQRFGEPDTVLINIQEQEGGTEAQAAAIERVKATLDDVVESYRRTEFVGPKVGEELKQAGILATALALAAMAVYIWFRFEWQFAVAGLVALIHDVFATIGFFALTQLEFNLGTVAAVLTIAGYSINDTVVIFDRVRETMRRYKRKAMPELLNMAVNATLTRTVLTSGTTLIALIALAIFGGAVIRSFTWGLIWGVMIGTFSSVGLAVPLLMFLGVKPSTMSTGEESEKEAAERAAGKASV
jgi:preprotein translocase SecF subunit